MSNPMAENESLKELMRELIETLEESQSAKRGDEWTLFSQKVESLLERAKIMTLKNKK
jgi:hypothetical protein